MPSNPLPSEAIPSPPQVNAASQPTYANGSHELLLTDDRPMEANDPSCNPLYDRDNGFNDDDDGISNPLIGMCLQHNSSDTSSQTALINHQQNTDQDHYSFILETHETLHPLNVPAGDSWV